LSSPPSARRLFGKSGGDIAMRATAPIAAALLIILPAAAVPATGDRIGALCSGSETVRVGAQPPRKLPYQIALSIDLAHGTYCYGACGKDQTYPVSATSGSRIKLSDVDAAGQSRRLTFDRKSLRLTDVQRLAMGALSVDRQARALCTPAPFHPPFGS
jgi:hypothetical protein